MRIAVGSDHAGFALRGVVVQLLRDGGHEVIDLGPADRQPVDYPTYAFKVARAVAAGDAERGVLICGTGIGMSMAANRVRGVRAALCSNTVAARATRRHNDANVLCLGERLLGLDVAVAIVETFMTESFEGGRHARRVEQIDSLATDAD